MTSQPNRHPVRILGIDPGLRRTGWGVVAIAGNRLSFPRLRVAGDRRQGRRSPAGWLPSMTGCGTWSTNHAPDEAAVEATFVNRDAVATLKLGQARGIAMLVPALPGRVAGGRIRAQPGEEDHHRRRPRREGADPHDDRRAPAQGRSANDRRRGRRARGRGHPTRTTAKVRCSQGGGPMDLGSTYATSRRPRPGADPLPACGERVARGFAARRVRGNSPNAHNSRWSPSPTVCFARRSTLSPQAGRGDAGAQHRASNSRVEHRGGERSDDRQAQGHRRQLRRGTASSSTSAASAIWCTVRRAPCKSCRRRANQRRWRSRPMCARTRSTFSGSTPNSNANASACCRPCRASGRRSHWRSSRALKPAELASAIALRDKAMVARTPGVGPKVAERIVTELKDKAPAYARCRSGGDQARRRDRRAAAHRNRSRMRSPRWSIWAMVNRRRPPPSRRQPAAPAKAPMHGSSSGSG